MRYIKEKCISPTSEEHLANEKENKIIEINQYCEEYILNTQQKKY